MKKIVILLAVLFSYTAHAQEHKTETSSLVADSSRIVLMFKPYADKSRLQGILQKQEGVLKKENLGIALGNRRFNFECLKISYICITIIPLFA